MILLRNSMYILWLKSRRYVSLQETWYSEKSDFSGLFVSLLKLQIIKEHMGSLFEKKYCSGEGLVRKRWKSFRDTAFEWIFIGKLASSIISAILLMSLWKKRYQNSLDKTHEFVSMWAYYDNKRTWFWLEGSNKVLLLLSSLYSEEKKGRSDQPWSDLAQI